ncbi:head-tail joining protein [Endozoicomonas ascidiicola]|uniref:head-tail joining protein n=1 Tax=Endozoicomonas ascidiicola TaxID=1698521 RepID=UPI0008312B55|nr:hypothetical protein [Endozoicomonas ascidiicola]
MSFMSAWHGIDQTLVDTLGEPVTLPGGHDVNGVFEFPTNDGSLGNVAMDYRSPVVTLTTPDANGLKKGDALTIREAVYTVSDTLPSGDGVTVVQLTEDQPDSGKGNWR